MNDAFSEFNYTLKWVDDGAYGSRLENGEWNGMLGEILENVRNTLNIFNVLQK